MRYIFCCITLILLSIQVSAQKKLSESIKHSRYTYIYLLNNDQLRLLHKNGLNSFNESYITKPVDSFLTLSSYNKTLKPGTYAFVKAQNSQLNYRIEQIAGINPYLFSSGKKFELIIAKCNSQIIDPEAKVYLNKKSIPFDKNTQTWHRKLKLMKGLLRVTSSGIDNYFTIDDDYNPRHFNYNYGSANSSFFSDYISLPIKKHVWNPIKRTFKGQNGNKRSQALLSKHAGFVVFSKPQYRPNDTVKLKAYITDTKGNAIEDDELVLNIGTSYHTDDLKQLGLVKSYRKGAFEYSFVLTDSLDLDLDETQTIYFQRKPSKNTKKKNDPNEGEQEIDVNKNTLIKGNFLFEDYELKDVQFTARVEKTFQKGEPIVVHCKAFDENDMAIPDGKVNITILTSYVSSFINKNVFVPDSILIHNQNLDPVGETRIEFPADKFPEANVNYRAIVTFLNSDNQRLTQHLQFNVEQNTNKLKAEFHNDSLIINWLKAGKPVSGQAKATSFTVNNDSLQTYTQQLPIKLPIQQLVRYYEIRLDSLTETLQLDDLDKSPSINAYRTPDSLFIDVDNPHQLNFWYSVTDGNKVIASGSDKKLQLIRKLHSSHATHIVVQYLWAGELKKLTQDISLNNKALDIQIKAPRLVYPGQRFNVELTASNPSGQPVQNADLTAFAFTSKFKSTNTPFVPSFGKRLKFTPPDYAKPEIDAFNHNGNLDLNWKRWALELKLDTNEYYRFLHTQSIYKNNELLPDTTAQLAPFVVKNGAVIPTHILYIDEMPVYFSKASHLQYYSFVVKPGYHKIRLRTTEDLITVDSVLAVKGRKTILGISADTSANLPYKIVKTPDTLTAYEQNFLSNYYVQVTNNFGDRPALLITAEHSYFLNPTFAKQGNTLAGPILHEWAQFNLFNGFKRNFTFEPSYTYTFQPDLIKMKSIEGKFPFDKSLSSTRLEPNFTEKAFEESEIERIWQQYLDLRAHTTQLFSNPYFLNDQSKARLQIGLGTFSTGKTPFVKNIIIYKHDDPDFMLIYPGNTLNIGKIPAGEYRILLLFKGDEYLLKEHIKVRPNGVTHFYTGTVNPNKKDSVSNKIAKIIAAKNGYAHYTSDDDLTKIKQAFNEKYLDESLLKNTVYGVILDKQNIPLPGVTVQVKGTGIKTMSDVNGKFSIKTPQKATLVLSFIGFETIEKPVQNGSYLTIIMNESSQALQEVVVVGYGTQKKASMVGSVGTVLQGKAEGIIIRGNSSLKGNDKPLVIVDGVPVEGDYPADDIQDVKILKGAEATAIYGAMAANGVVIITTKQNKQPTSSEVAQNGSLGLRKNFSDVAFWQPKLTTNQSGKVSFKVTMPDDISKWKATVIGVGGDKLTGIVQHEFKSFKSLTATLAVPRFAVEGDSLNILGKISNYTGSESTVLRTVSINDKQLKEGDLKVKNATVDTIAITAIAMDSIKATYSLKLPNGYSDGEERFIPVYKQGVIETEGVFHALEGDTTVTMQLRATGNPITFRAEASALPVLLNEIETIRNYEYQCNEQLASKLKALLTEKKIRYWLKQPFNREENIKELIKKLQDNRGVEGDWGWWPGTKSSLWISQHVTEALIEAMNSGYKITLNAQPIIDKLLYHFEDKPAEEQIRAIHTLKKLKASPDYIKLITQAEHSILNLKYKPNGYTLLNLLLLKQEHGLKVNTDSLSKAAQKTLFGNLYWGEDCYRFFDNSIQQTIVAYKILRASGANNTLLSKIRNYFFEQRKSGQWRNTYESSLILETILPDLLQDRAEFKPTRLIIGGSKAETIEKFPYEIKLPAQASITVQKTGSLPAYITAYQQFWNKKPEKVSKDFTVDTYFELNGVTQKNLKAGVLTQLMINVEVKADADYVMIEVPIPSGCSYGEKTQSFWGTEIHREYLKNKTSIFCTKLKKGKHSFYINLVPRFSGRYNLNPAKAELMYFPVFYGRENIRQIEIK
ncbi:carboxypeptidase-like regulatory domain-containing protein [Solitalea lacus]|uniref:carboxypeptidase-like regulatory domain-containing protein n=1 Tax=Solitalea lacus TaxID=2911172 RepID=UPI001EDA5724|nr:alpha-2-macroglobulin family protein [Solitalea lacus]UKJ06984.1 carboxypeptidase-like regulatory domain-containing protein [Solitalea lacus]